MERIDRKSSIENEPRTLKMNQIQFAREAALYVINTTSIEEAMRIFTEGLEPVKCSKASEEEDRDPMMMENCYNYEQTDEFFKPAALYNRLRDIVSAPF